MGRPPKSVVAFSQPPPTHCSNSRKIVADMKISIEAVDHFILDDELIVFSPKHQQYFGIDGVGRWIIETLIARRTSMHEAEIFAALSTDPTANSPEAGLIREGIHSLQALGVLRET